MRRNLTTILAFTWSVWAMYFLFTSHYQLVMDLYREAVNVVP